ncbi:SOS response-associated peptidase family protein [Kitasatospora gansuensis]
MAPVPASCVVLAAPPCAVDRAGTAFGPRRAARAWLESITARDQSNCPADRNSSSRTRCSRSAGWLTTFTILTTEAVDAAGRIHDRMPVTLHPDALDTWLDPETTDPGHLRDLIHAPAADLTVRPVVTTVNNVRSDGPQLLTEVEDPLPGTAGTHFA